MAQAGQGQGELASSKEEISYIARHVFLVPGPKTNDYDVRHDGALLKSVIQTLDICKDYLRGSQINAANAANTTLKHLYDTHGSFDGSAKVDEAKLLRAFEALSQEGVTIAIHVREQNCGVLFSRPGASVVHAQMFELSPRNRDVISCIGRLRRLFPGSSVAIPLAVFQSQEFQATVAYTLSKMSYQAAPNTHLYHDTTHPKAITELFSAFLRSIGTPIHVASISKNTREEVFFQEGSLWHRSALWLLVRVTLQLGFSRSEISQPPELTYKTFMLLFMTNILHKSQAFDLPSDVLSAMCAKLSSRQRKFTRPIPRRLKNFMESTLSATHDILQSRWARIQEQSSIHNKLERLCNLDFQRDTHTDVTALDEYIKRVASRGDTNSNATICLTCPLEKNNAYDEPKFNFSSGSAYDTFRLATFESWVSTDMEGWIAANIMQPNTTGVLRGLMEGYHKAALHQYAGNPEALSVMILTILELWVASDMSAIQNHRLLIKYDPEVPKDLLQNLNLPLMSQMVRLMKIEQYLHNRSSQATLSSSEVFHTLDGPNCFGAQYFGQSEVHQTLYRRINEDATREREAKLAEFREKKQQYQDLIRDANKTSHDIQMTGTDSSTHTLDCLRCKLENQASSITIQIHEWPLPEDESRAQAITFELQVPCSFGNWRDSTIFLLSNVLRFKYKDIRSLGALQSLQEVSLSRYFLSFGKQRITLMSENKTSNGYLKIKDIITNSSRVCVSNRLHFRYFDEQTNSFTRELEPTEEIAELSTYTVPASPLQQFIFRPATKPSGPSPNTVLATQSTCPDNISIEEYKALASLPLGYRVQWQNILVQLASPSVDLRVESTVFVALQCILQAGPCTIDDARRDGHLIVDDLQFGDALLNNLKDALKRSKNNWQSFPALGLFISITRRLLSLASTADVQLRSLELLSSCRETAKKWIDDLGNEVQRSTDERLRADLRIKQVGVALVCVDTFNVDDGYLSSLLASPDDARTLIQCAITIEEGPFHMPPKSLASIMLNRWKQLAYRSYNTLVTEIIDRESPALSNAIKDQWPAFSVGVKWTACTSPYHHWLYTKFVPLNGREELLVHFSLLTGELLIQGLPLKRLPAEYTKHPTYAALFGNASLEVVPSSIPGMRFSCKDLFHGHQLDFGMDEAKNLAIQARTGGRTFEFIPANILLPFLPAMFINNFIHWFSLDEGYLEFCMKPWYHSNQNWRLSRSEATGLSWKMARGDAVLVGMNSPTARAIADILSPLEVPQWMQITLHDSLVDIELPRLELQFFLKQWETSLYSRQYRGMRVDEDQKIGTLIGLRSGLVLKSGPRRKVIIPNGKVTFDRVDQHMDVTVDKGSATKAHVYEVDNLLGRVIDDGSLESKLLLSYLHSLTSFVLPDPLTRRTGTEQALTILDSAAIKSFKSLSDEDNDRLGEIASLTPKREYHPKHDRYAQAVQWDPKLSFSAQHDQAKTLKFLDEESRRLLQRDMIRSATFYVSGFGAEAFNTRHDVSYMSRDQTATSEEQVEHLHADLTTNIWKFLLHNTSRMEGPGKIMQKSQLNYDAWLLGTDGNRSIARDFIPLLQLLSSRNPRPNKFQVMIWLAAYSFPESADMTITQVLAAFWANTFEVYCGSQVVFDELFDHLQSTYLEFNHSPLRDSKQTQRREFYENSGKILYAFCKALVNQWPCEIPMPMIQAKSFFAPRYENYQLVKYLNQILNMVPRHAIPIYIQPVPRMDPSPGIKRKAKFFSNKDIFCSPAPTELLPSLEIMTQNLTQDSREKRQVIHLPKLLFRLDKQAQSKYELDYVKKLRTSNESLQDWKKNHHLTATVDEMRTVMKKHRDECQKVVDRTFVAMVQASTPDQEAVMTQHRPRVSPCFFLQHLGRDHWQSLPEDWKKCILHYGVAITQLQRAERLLGAVNNRHALITELRNTGHEGWRVEDHPEWLLLEIENSILVRPIQAQIAASMMSPETDINAVMQLNMGEGKSSVIVPLVATALADGSQLVRVIVAKPQNRQMFQMLLSKLGGLVNRRIFLLPFSRSVRVELPQVNIITEMFDECKRTGGILLTQPEHILSYKLMGVECTLSGKDQIGRALIQSQDNLDASTRDIVDESDENFSVKFELVYTVGIQQPVMHSPMRWICVQQLLDILREIVMGACSDLHSSIEVYSQSPGCFPIIRFLQPEAGEYVLSRVAERICMTGLRGCPIARQREDIRQATYRYIIEARPSAKDIALVEGQGEGGCFNQSLLLLRGLIAGGVLAFAFGHKRWRVDYGCNPNRQPITKLAVPFRAKDNPSPRSEFSHPDVVIILTSLSYYYAGLDKKDLLRTFKYLLKSDQASVKYQAWVKDVCGVPPALDGINLEDRTQFTHHVYPQFRYAKAVIDYFLSHLVFPKEMKGFPYKLSASGWDIAEVKEHLTTGFSGTNDSRQVLPLDVTQLDLEDQKHTNALVLENLLKPENSVDLLPPRRSEDESIAEMLLNVIVNMEQQPRVILDVGAQILELSNREVAGVWLNKMSDTPEKTQAVVYVDDNDELRVLNRKDHDEPLQTSPFLSQLDVCLVFLDEAHTRGIDLKLPSDYRAAVTLGANLTKDRLVQACMRMRMLGEGQSVVFCVPNEIQIKIRALKIEARRHSGLDISIVDILAWSIGETWRDMHRSMSLWATQGRRNEHHKEIWKEARSNREAEPGQTQGINFSQNLAQEYLEDDVETLESKYRPRITTGSRQSTLGDGTDPISLRCSEFKDLNLDSAILHEEEERELAQEVEEERENQRPPGVEAAPHAIHPDVKAFVRSGAVVGSTSGYKPAFLALRKTGAAEFFNVLQFRRGLLVTHDFATTIKSSGNLDLYQRSVQWILTSGPPDAVTHMMVISPFEAHVLLPTIEQSEVIALHVYAPRSNLAHRRLDTLDLYTVPERLKTRHVPEHLITELNLFAGQLYQESFKQYVDVCNFLGIAYEAPGEDEEIAADGFILQDSEGRVGGGSGLRNSPVEFFKALYMEIRHNCQTIDKTHMGKLLDNQLLEPSDFEK
ncbi:hypothetical protein GGR53DRAFT_524076 [Hypoxylon sp. FL1150]|nr:hypothetical protein GGR53DRAFT_524076 [Hypoxylon sp. FL1150]